ncbi:MAG: cbb3-type cytochrome c oxidase subunit 3 [Hyphomonas sp.]|nr:cbb3-type cytochrome c oxidase subunit 3 [Hyphomonas sp.]MCB9971580.1 cbb3-type cytochrome c oxidase subunit 3 [Hyphomonas sp.]
MYETLSRFAQTWGFGFFMLMFAVAVAYALWPSNKSKFQAAARVPLDEGDPTDE